MGLYNNFEATLYESIDYIDTKDGTLADAQSVQLVPTDRNKWPINAQQYFTANPCYMYMTFFHEPTGISATYKCFFDDTLTSTADVVTVKALLEERPAFDANLPSFVLWPVGTRISNTANKYTISEYQNAALDAINAVGAEVDEANLAIAANTASINTNAQSILNNATEIEQCTVIAEANATEIARLNSDVDRVEADIVNLQTKQSVTPRADSIPVTPADSTHLNIGYIPVATEQQIDDESTTTVLTPAGGAYLARTTGMDKNMSNFEMTAASKLNYKVMYNRSTRLQLDPDNPHAYESDHMPISVIKNSKYVVPSPYGFGTPILCLAEIYVDGEWADAGFQYTKDGGYNYSAGVVAHMNNMNGIVMKTGRDAIVAAHNGSGFNTDSVDGTKYVRIHVWKLGV